MGKRDTGQGLEHQSVVLAGGRRSEGRPNGVLGHRGADTDGLPRATVRTGAGLLLGAVGAWMVISGLLARKWPWQLYGDQTSQSDVLKLALGVVAAGGAAIALVVNYRRQQYLERDDAGKRDQTRLFTERFGAAAAQLGGDRPAVRLAGVYAMAALADEWTSNRQQCVDVLCGYLRLPYTGEPPPGHPQLVVEQRQYAGGTIQRTESTTYQAGEIQVRKAIVATIAQHLLGPDADQSWSNLNFDFNGAILIDAAFVAATFSGDITSFNNAMFSGDRTSFDNATFSTYLTSFDGATFSSDRTSFDNATFSSPITSFDGATFSGDRTSFDRTSGDGVTFSGDTASFVRATFSSTTTSFLRATFSSTDTRFDGATFSSIDTWFAGATFSGTDTRFDGATFSSTDTRFDEATFSGKSLSFHDAEFADPDAALRDARMDAQKIGWGPVPPRSAWPPAASTEEKSSLG